MTPLFRLACLFTLALLVLAPSAAADEADLATARQLEDEARYADAATAYMNVLASPDCPFDIHVRYQTTATRGGTPVEDLVAWYDGWLEKEPESVKAKLHRLRLDPASKRKKPLAALKKAHPDELDVSVEIGRMQLETGDAKKAVSTLKKAMATAPAARTDIALLFAEAHFQAGDEKSAVKDLVLLLTSKSELQEGWIQLARYHLAAGRFEDAAIASNKALVIRPTHIVALLARAEAERGLGKREEALATLTTAQRVNAEHLAVLVALADVVAAEETETAFARAATLYQQVLAVDEEHMAALHGLGWVYEREEKYEEALGLYEQLAAVRPEDPMGHNSVGVCLFKMGQVSRSQSKFKAAIDRDKKFAAALANLGMTYDAQAKYSQAIKIYEKVLKMNGQKENLRVLIACAFDFESVGSLPKGAKMLERAHEVKPDDADICVWLGDNAYFQKKWKVAEKWYTKAMGLDDESFQAWRGLGYTLIERKKFDDAIKALENARRLGDPPDPNVSLNLGDLYLDEVENEEKALELYKEYVERGGDDEAITELIEELERRIN